MFVKIIKLLLLIFIIGLVLYFVRNNPAQVTFTLWPGYVYNATVGIISVCVFSSALVVAALVWSFFSLPLYFKQKSLLSFKHKTELFFKKQLEARSALSIGDLAHAKVIWEQLLAKDPSGVVARVELSSISEKLEKFKEGLAILEPIRKDTNSNPEVLLRLANLNYYAGNKSAALEALNQLLSISPALSPCKFAMQIAEELNQYQDALEYETLAQSLSGTSVETADSIRLRFLCLKSKHDNREDSENFIQDLDEFITKYPSYALARSSKGYFLLKKKYYTEALEEFSQAILISSNTRYIDELANHSKSPDVEKETFVPLLVEALEKLATSKQINKASEIHKFSRLVCLLLRLYLNQRSITKARKLVNDVDVIIKKSMNDFQEFKILSLAVAIFESQNNLDSSLSNSVLALANTAQGNPDEIYFRNNNTATLLSSLNLTVI
jgi:tetratricopeptide (TPR) repeat protein